MILFPNAKINIGLNIIRKRQDGFHDIESCFYPVDWKDVLEVVPNQSELSFQSTGIEIPGDESSNLCVKAYELIKRDYDIAPVYIHLHKNIPIGAGLGGGSADATFTLKALNELYELGLSNRQLEAYAKQLGSDCAFFVENKPVLAIDKGDVFQALDFSLAGKWIVLVYPDVHVSTSEAYAGVMPDDCKTGLSKVLAKEIGEWGNDVWNDFEDSLAPKYAYINNLKDKLKQKGALYTSLSGSGSTVYGIFDKAPAVEDDFGDYQVLVTQLA